METSSHKEHTTKVPSKGSGTPTQYKHQAPLYGVRYANSRGIPHSINFTKAPFAQEGSHT